MELLFAAQLIIVGVGIFAFVRISRLSHRVDADERRLSLFVERIQISLEEVEVDLTRVEQDIRGTVSVRDSMDQEIRERQASIDSIARLVGRQSRAISEHIESNLHRG